MPYLSGKMLKGFDRYKYNAIDTSPLSQYVLHPFWNWVVKLFPRWLAPNVLTFSGFLLQVLGLVVLTVYDKDFYAGNPWRASRPVPSWVWLLNAGCIFFAHTLDGIDGKQARRVGASGPLGELFDHGIDSWAAFFMPIAVFSLFGRGLGSVTVFTLFYVLIGVQLVFISTHWEKYNTGVLYLPWNYDVSQLFMTICYLISYFYGLPIWQTELPFLQQWLALSYTPAMTDFLQFGMFMSCAFGVVVSVINMLLSYRDGTGRKLPFYEAVLPMFPAVILWLATTCWVSISPSNILEAEPKLLMFLMGTIFSNIACRLIVSQMSSTRADPFNWMLLPLVGFVGALLLGPTGFQLHSVGFRPVLYATSQLGLNKTTAYKPGWLMLKKPSSFSSSSTTFSSCSLIYTTAARSSGKSPPTSKSMSFPWVI